MSGSEQLNKLADRARQAEKEIQAAKEESQAQLQARVEHARRASEQRAGALKGGADETRVKASKWWGEVQEDWNKHIAKIHKDGEAWKAEHDLKRAERHAEHREEDALAAVDYAYAALEEADYAVLDAMLARQQADELAAVR